MGEREHQPRAAQERGSHEPPASEGEPGFTLVPNEGTDEVLPRAPRRSPSLAGQNLGAGLRVGTGLRIGPWTLEREIGRGGMATVYLARHSQLGTPAALKLLHGQFSQQSQRLILEGRLQANLRHPNVLAVHDVEWFDHSLALVLEYVDGPDLQHRIRGGPRLNLAQIEAIVRGVLDGVQAAHRAGIVHRDLKPSNVLLAGPAEAPVPKVSDFGIAKFRGGLPGQSSGPRWLGTPGYMAPEQFVHADRVDQRADIYALGCIFYEMVTGRPVYDGPVDLNDILRRARAADPPLGEYIPITDLAPDTPPRIVAAIESALQTDVERRPESCEALLAIWDGRHPGTASRVGALLAMEIFAEGEGQARAIREICAQDAAVAGLDQRFHRRETAEDGILFFPTPGEATGYAQQFRELVQHRSANLTVRCDLRIAIGAGTRTGAARPADIVRRLVSLAGRDRTLVVGPVREGTGHGWYRLAGIPEPIEVYEVPTDGSQRDRPIDPPGDTVAAWRVERHDLAHGPLWLPKAPIPHNLLRGSSAYGGLSQAPVPSRLAPLVGRDQELLALERTFEEGTRCVHLLGPEGAGKTLLAQHFAWSTLGWWPGGVWMVDVSTARGRFELTELLLWNVEPLTDDAGTEPEDLGPCLARLRRCLIVLDGADLLETDALVMLEQWRAEAPEVHMLLVAAACWQVAPDARALELGPLSLAATSQLLRERLGDRPSASRALSQLAALLGGLPLACELLAACAGVMDLQALADSLERALSGSQPPSSDDILSAALSFAWQQLNEAEQSALLQCTVFEGGFTLRTAARVLDLADPVVALWSRRWLLVTGEDRFDLHPRVRAFLEGQLRAHPGNASASLLAAEKRHAAFFASSAALHELRWETPNLVAACQRSMAGWTSLAVSACLRMREVVGETRVAVEIAASMLGQRGTGPLPGLSPADRARLIALAARPRWLVAELARDRRDRSEVADRSLEALQTALALFEEARELAGAGEVARQMGDIQRLLGRFTEARESYQVALLAYHDVHHFDHDAAILRQLAEMSHALGQLDQARQEYRAALSSARPDDRATQGALKLQLARVERDSGQLEAALGLLEEARAALGDDRVALARVDQYRLELERELARSVSRVWGRLPAEEPALPHALEPQGRAERAPDGASLDAPPEAGSTPAPVLEDAGADWLVVGRRYRDHGQLGRALEWFGAIRDPARRPRALREAGAIHRMRGALDQAIASIQAAVAALRRQPSEDPGEAASARHLLAELYEQREQRADTFEKLEAELARHLASGECVSEGQTRARLVLHHLELGEIDRALLHCERAVAIHRQVGDPRAEAIDLGNLGNLQYEVGRWDLAASLFQEALVLHREVGNASGEGAVASNLAHLLKLQQRYDEAALWYQRALEKHRQADRPARLAQTLGNLGDIDRIQDRLESARSRLSDAALIAEELGDPRLKAVLLGQRASLEARFDLDAAEELFDAATALFCAHPDPVDLGWLLAARAEVALDRGGKGLAHKLLDEIPLLFPPPGAPLLLQRRRLRDRSH